MSKENCILCQIIEGNIPSQKIYEDDLCVAILDVNGASLGHTFVIPKNHYPIFEQIPDDEVGHLFTVANKISGMLFEKLQSIQGTNIFVANGIPAGQRVAHFMIHVVPRTENDGINLQWQPRQISEDEMGTAEVKLKDQLQGVGVSSSPAPTAPVVGADAIPTSFDTEDEDDYFMHHVDKVPRG